MSPKIDPEFRDLIPPLSSEERSGLEESIRKDGCRDHLSVWKEEEILLDGHNRLAICEEHGVPFQTYSVSLKDRTAAKVWIIKNQVSRRNLNESQRAMLAAKLATLERGDNQHTQICGTSQGDAARLFNVSQRTVTSAKRVLTAGSPELQAAVSTGQVPVSVAAEIATVPVEEQRAILGQNEAGIQRHSKEIKAKRVEARVVEPAAPETEHRVTASTATASTTATVDEIERAIRHLSQSDREGLLKKLVGALSTVEFAAFYEALGQRYLKDREFLKALKERGPETEQSR